MRGLWIVGAAFSIASAVSGTAFADGPAPSGKTARPARAGWVCPPRVVHRAHRVVYHRRFWSQPVAFMAPPPAYYNPPLPSPADPAYDRAMVLHLRAPPVSGSYTPEPGYPPTPPVVGVHPYRIRYGQGMYEGVYQYDGLIGGYVRLAWSDAARALPPPPPPGW